ncbi:hypothetical protein QCA50_003449 [Cerrena zonata]|uniref:Uncharacterized protein n=1 Tax=Cerrena zonata TaxID=2478898 RepID=A0AAW0GKC1_9APHY
MNDRYLSPYQGYSAHSPSLATASTPGYESPEYEPPFLLPIPGDMTVEPHPLPLYNQPPQRRHMRRPAQSTPIRCDDLLKTVDYRFITPPPSYRRHSFALSSIYEEDEEDEGSDVLRSPATSTSSGSCFPTKKLVISAKIVDFLNSLRDKLSKAGPTRVIKSNNRSTNLDLLL